MSNTYTVTIGKTNFVVNEKQKTLMDDLLNMVGDDVSKREKLIKDLGQQHMVTKRGTLNIILFQLVMNY